MNIKILTGEDVTNTYKYPSKYTFSSMSGERLGEYTRFYEDNPDKVGLVTTYDNKGDMTTRALLWTCDDGSKMLDYIYGMRGYGVKLLKWADKNNIDVVYDLKHLDYKKYKITMKIKRNAFPFIDTFGYGEFNRDYSEVVLSCYLNDKTNVLFHSHDGYCFLP